MKEHDDYKAIFWNALKTLNLYNEVISELRKESLLACNGFSVIFQALQLDRIKSLGKKWFCIDLLGTKKEIFVSCVAVVLFVCLFCFSAKQYFTYLTESKQAAIYKVKKKLQMYANISMIYRILYRT